MCCRRFGSCVSRSCWPSVSHSCFWPLVPPSSVAVGVCRRADSRTGGPFASFSVAIGCCRRAFRLNSYTRGLPILRPQRLLPPQPSKRNLARSGENGKSSLTKMGQQLKLYLYLVKGYGGAVQPLYVMEVYLMGGTYELCSRRCSG